MQQQGFDLGSSPYLAVFCMDACILSLSLDTSWMLEALNLQNHPEFTPKKVFWGMLFFVGESPRPPLFPYLTSGDLCHTFICFNKHTAHEVVK